MLVECRFDAEHQSKMAVTSKFLDLLERKAGLSPNSCSTISFARHSRNPRVTARKTKIVGTVPAHPTLTQQKIGIRPLSFTTREDSQKPRALLPFAGGIRFLGSVAPRRLMTRAVGDVPERCIPATTIACRAVDIVSTSTTRTNTARWPHSVTETFADPHCQWMK